MWQWLAFYFFVFIVASFIIVETDAFYKQNDINSDQQQIDHQQSDHFEPAAFLNRLGYAMCGAAACAAGLVVALSQTTDRYSAMAAAAAAPFLQAAPTLAPTLAPTAPTTTPSVNTGSFLADALIGALSGIPAGIDLDKLICSALAADRA